MVSNHADKEAYTFLLNEFRKAVRQTARDYVAGRFEYEIDGVDPSELRKMCMIVAEDGLTPRFMMIDGCDAERMAIRQVFPGIPLRACQFHLMQACRSKIRRILGRIPNADTLGSAILDAIRKCQRCPSAAEWDHYYDELGQEVTRIVGDSGSAWTHLKDYLDREWFSERWREFVVDYALPRSVTRDGPWSTNNYSESCFRSFDRVILNCRANKR